METLILQRSLSLNFYYIISLHCCIKCFNTYIFNPIWIKMVNKPSMLKCLVFSLLPMLSKSSRINFMLENNIWQNKTRIYRFRRYPKVANRILQCWIEIKKQILPYQQISLSFNLDICCYDTFCSLNEICYWTKMNTWMKTKCKKIYISHILSSFYFKIPTLITVAW